MEHKLKIEDHKNKLNKFGFDLAKKEDVMKIKQSLQSQIYGAEAHIQRVKMQLNETDQYLDRYLPVKMLNLIHEFVEETIISHNERKAFCEKLKRHYGKLE